jgi:hypothetical protein
MNPTMICGICGGPSVYSRICSGCDTHLPTPAPLAIFVPSSPDDDYTDQDADDFFEATVMDDLEWWDF